MEIFYKKNRKKVVNVKKKKGKKILQGRTMGRSSMYLIYSDLLRVVVVCMLFMEYG